MIKCAVEAGDQEVATIYATSRLFMLRVPSECLPLQLAGEHSEVHIGTNDISLTLFRRKNCSGPTVIHRRCVCATEGRTLCAVCALKLWIDRFRGQHPAKLFRVSAKSFVKYMRRDAARCGLTGAALLGSHAWRRGMAQDIVNAGGSLATLLRAGQWRSSAFRVYLQQQALDEDAVAKLVIDHSDDEALGEQTT